MAAAAGIPVGENLLPTMAAAAPVAPVAPSLESAPPPTPVVAQAPAAPAPAAPAAPDLTAELAHWRQEAAAAKRLQEEMAAQAAELEALRAQVLSAPATPAPTSTPAAPERLSALEQELAAARAELAAAKAPKLDPASWDPDSPVDFTQAKALWTAFEPMIQAQIEERAKVIAQARAQELVQPLQQQITGDITQLRETQQRTARTAFEARVVEREPLAPTIVPSVAFKSFLAAPMPHVGLTYGEVFRRNIDAQSIDGVLHVIQAYKASLPAGDTSVDAPAGAAPAAPVQNNPSAPLQVEDLSALRQAFRKREISHAEFHRRLVAAEQAVRHVSGAIH